LFGSKTKFSTSMRRFPCSLGNRPISRVTLRQTGLVTGKGVAFGRRALSQHLYVRRQNFEIILETG
jgi:hypothetical protein